MKSRISTVVILIWAAWHAFAIVVGPIRNAKISKFLPTNIIEPYAGLLGLHTRWRLYSPNPAFGMRMIVGYRVRNDIDIFETPRYAELEIPTPREDHAAIRFLSLYLRSGVKSRGRYAFLSMACEELGLPVGSEVTLLALYPSFVTKEQYQQGIRPFDARPHRGKVSEVARCK